MSNDDTGGDGPDHAGVRVPPPLIFLFFLTCGLWIDSPWFQGATTSLSAMIWGGCIAGLGVAVLIVAGAGHFAAGTHVEPWKPTSVIVSTGLYAHSRNPMYLGMAVGQVGIAVAGGSFWGVLMVVPSIAVVQAYVIAREERYLEVKFGDAYLSYKAQVRRWI